MNHSSSAPEEVILQGVPASPGTVVGKAFVHTSSTPSVDADFITDDAIPDHIQRFKEARKQLHEQWKQLREDETRKESRDILAAQIEIILDPDLSEQIENGIRSKQRTTQHAIKKAFANYIALMEASGSEKMAGRLIDLTDIRDRLIEASGSKPRENSVMEGDILVSKDISPREVIHLSNQKVKGFIMEKGGHTSHAAIIARSMGIPAVVGLKGAEHYVQENTTICLNGESGLVTFNPSAETREQAKIRAGSSSQSLDDKIAICGRSSQTTDAHAFTIRANVEFPEELHHVDQFKAQGIGLLRTESMYLDKQEFGSIKQQVKFYENFMQTADDHPVVIRLFDVGGDKFQESGNEENNPFLGWRGIRMLLDERTVLKNQLKAILTVAEKYPGRIKLLIPMVSSLKEVTDVKNEIETCRGELAGQGQPINVQLPVGMMVEIPAAALHAAYFTREVDFFSIGTNDLTQYMLAVDRGNAFISGRYDQRHPAVWKVIDHVVRAAENSNTEVEICGELASYPVAAACLIGMGISILSMSPVSIPQIKKILTERSYKEMEKLAEQVLHCKEIQDVKTLFNNWKSRKPHA